MRINLVHAPSWGLDLGLPSPPMIVVGVSLVAASSGAGTAGAATMAIAFLAASVAHAKQEKRRHGASTGGECGPTTSIQRYRRVEEEDISRPVACIARAWVERARAARAGAWFARAADIRLNDACDPVGENSNSGSEDVNNSGGNGAALSHAVECFGVSLQRRGKEPWGFVCSNELGPGLIVVSVSADSPIGRWNSRQRDLRLQTLECGDKLVAANCATELCMIQHELDTADVVHLQFLRLDANGSDAGGTVHEPNPLTTPEKILPSQLVADPVTSAVFGFRVRNSFLEVAIFGDESEDDLSVKSDPMPIRTRMPSTGEAVSGCRPGPPPGRAARLELLDILQDSERYQSQSPRLSSPALGTGCCFFGHTPSGSPLPSTPCSSSADCLGDAGNADISGCQPQVSFEEPAVMRAADGGFREFAPRPPEPQLLPSLRAGLSQALCCCVNGSGTMGSGITIPEDTLAWGPYLLQPDLECIGKKAVMFGLQHTPQFNGQLCQVEAYDSNEQRYIVSMLLNNEEEVQVSAKMRHENLLVLPAAGDPEPGAQLPLHHARLPGCPGAEDVPDAAWPPRAAWEAKVAPLVGVLDDYLPSVTPHMLQNDRFSWPTVTSESLATHQILLGEAFGCIDDAAAKNMTLDYAPSDTGIPEPAPCSRAVDGPDRCVPPPDQCLAFAADDGSAAEGAGQMLQICSGMNAEETASSGEEDTFQGMTAVENVGTRGDKESEQPMMALIQKQEDEVKMPAEANVCDMIGVQLEFEERGELQQAIDEPAEEEHDGRRKRGHKKKGPRNRRSKPSNAMDHVLVVKDGIAGNTEDDTVGIPLGDTENFCQDEAERAKCSAAVKAQQGADAKDAAGDGQREDGKEEETGDQKEAEQEDKEAEGNVEKVEEEERDEREYHDQYEVEVEAMEEVEDQKTNETLGGVERREEDEHPEEMRVRMDGGFGEASSVMGRAEAVEEHSMMEVSHGVDVEDTDGIEGVDRVEVAGHARRAHVVAPAQRGITPEEGSEEEVVQVEAEIRAGGEPARVAAAPEDVWVVGTVFVRPDDRSVDRRCRKKPGRSKPGGAASAAQASGGAGTSTRSSLPEQWQPGPTVRRWAAAGAVHASPDHQQNPSQASGGVGTSARSALPEQRQRRPGPVVSRQAAAGAKPPAPHAEDAEAGHQSAAAASKACGAQWRPSLRTSAQGAGTAAPPVSSDGARMAAGREADPSPAGGEVHEKQGVSPHDSPLAARPAAGVGSKWRPTLRCSTTCPLDNG